MPNSIRVHGDTYKSLRDMKGDDESIQDVVEKLLEIEIEGEVIERPEEETVGVVADKSIVEEVNDRAGENMSANDVIETLLEQYDN